MGFLSLELACHTIYFVSLVESCRIDDDLRILLLAAETNGLDSLPTALNHIRDTLDRNRQPQTDSAENPSNQTGPLLYNLADGSRYSDDPDELSGTFPLPNARSSVHEILNCYDDLPPPPPGRKTRMQAKIMLGVAKMTLFGDFKKRKNII
jgi:hypothetical protein